MTVYADLIRYRELFGNLFRRDLHAKYKGSVLGVVWVLIPPLVLMGVYLLAFPLAALLVCVAAGLALTLACLNVLYRDVEHLVGALLLPWFFLTPIIYSLSQFHHPRLTEVLRYANPITPPIEAIRAPLWAG